MRKEGLPLQRLLAHESLTDAGRRPALADVSALYAAVGEGNLGAQAVVRRVIDLHGGDDGRGRGPRRGASRSPAARPPQARRPAATPGVIVKGAPDVWVKLAKCCTPVPRRRDPRLRHPRRRASRCTAATAPTPASLQRQPERLVEVEWAPTAQSTFLVNIQVEALDRARLLSDITMVLSDAHVNILSAPRCTTSRDRVAKSRFTFEMADPKHLGTVLKAVRSVDGVFDAYRVTQ